MASRERLPHRVDRLHVQIQSKSPMSQLIHRQQTATGQPPGGQVMIRSAAVAGPSGPGGRSAAEEEPGVAGEVVDAGEETLQGNAKVEIPGMRGWVQTGTYLLGQKNEKYKEQINNQK